MSVKTPKGVATVGITMSENALGEASSDNGGDGDNPLVCDSCGKEYESKQGIKYHYKTDNNPCKSDIECPTCGKATFYNNHGVRLHHSNAHNESIAGDKVTCEQCGDTTRVTPSKLNRGKNHFCDPKCRGEWFSENQVGEDHHQYNRVEVECDWCGDTITRSPSQINDNLNFCNAEVCQAKWNSHNNRGKDHPNWQGGDSYIDYGSNWKPQRRKAKERDDYECQVCGMTKEEQGYALDVHHIVPIESYDDPKDANRLQNLITLCRGHHRKYEGWNLIPQT